MQSLQKEEESNESNDLLYYNIDPEGVDLINNYKEDIGKDLLTNIDFEIEPKGYTSNIPTNICIKLPEGTYGRIAEKSSLATKGIGVLGGVIDAGYSGEIKVTLSNHSDKKIVFKKGDRIAQLICEKVKYTKIKKVSPTRFENLHSESERKNRGFGSLK